MIEVTIRIQANTLEEAFSELHTTPIQPPCETPQQTIEVHLPAEKQKQEPVKQEEEKPAPQKQPEEKPKEIKPEEVRAMLVKVREAGLDLVKILEPYGGRFPDVKKEDYASLLKDAQDALSQKENN